MTQYNFVRSGHLYQSKRTGPGPSYSFDYSNNYNKLPSDSMSIVRYELMEKYIPDVNSVCDFGYGNGAFIKHCHEKGKNSFAYDISDYPAPEGVHRLESIDDLTVDVMTFFDSLEHIEQEDLVPFLKSIKTKYFVISVPWFHQFLGKEWFDDWKHRKPNEHFHHFDMHGLVGLLYDANCDIIHVGNEEDVIRKSASQWPNILTVIARKK